MENLLSFEVYYVSVAQNLQILEKVNHFFLAWTLATAATSRGPNFDLSNLNRVSNFNEILFVDKDENLEALDCVLQNGFAKMFAISILFGKVRVLFKNFGV